MEKITASDISNFDTCGRKVWLKNFEKDFEPAQISGFLQYLIDQGNLFEKECIDTLDEFVTPSNFDETLAYMKQGEKFIYQAVLQDDSRYGICDLLRRVDNVNSIFGNYAYEVIDIKSGIIDSSLIGVDDLKFEKKSKELQKKYGLQVFHYFDLLSSIQEFSSEIFVWVKDKNKEKSNIYFEIKFDEKVKNSFKNRKPIEENYLTIFEKINEMKKESEIEPFNCSACTDCEWKDFCFEKMEKQKHCSLIRGVQKRGLDDLNNLGIKTYEDFFNKVDEKTKIKYVLNGTDSYKVFRMRKQAQSLIENKDFYLGDTLKPFTEDYLLFYDIEGEMGGEFEYLHGVWEVNQNTQEKKYISFIDSKQENEGKIWQDFLDYINAIKEKGSFKIIYFANYEKAVWNKMTEKYSTSQRDLDLLLNNSIDILSEWIDNKLIIPRYNYSIKTVAPYFGFVWECKENKYVGSDGIEFSLDEANGGESIAWLDYWLSGEQVYKQIILDYNKDDCVGTEYVYNKMIENYGGK